MTWNLDPNHSSIEFNARHMLFAKVRGSFAEFNVDAEVDESDLAASRATVTIDAASINTREENRDGHLRSADFLDAENHPKITFVTRQIKPKGGNDYDIKGDLTIRGVTREVVFETEIGGPMADPWGNKRISITGETKVNRKDWGLNWNAAIEAGGVLVGESITLQIDAELVKAA
ncbi:MAG TPA: YceI family protein [Tepidiformaceae bacterium]|nr:YceI family protein [Tepidiformaceae bacterium]